jgi:undecaprenyl-diphosphatase
MNSINLSIFRSINDLGFNLTFLNPVIIFIAQYGVYFLALWMILHWFFSREKVRTRMVLAGSLFAFFLSEVIGKVLGRFIVHPQPFATLPHVNQLVSHEIDNSFPSDHTILFFSICMMLFLGSKSSKRSLYLVAATLVGISRIWVGVHYPVDILVAALIGITVSSILYPFIIHSRMVTTFTKKTKESNIDIK